MIEHREGDVLANPDILGAIDVWANGAWVTIQPMDEITRLREENEKLREALEGMIDLAEAANVMEDPAYDIARKILEE